MSIFREILGSSLKLLLLICLPSVVSSYRTLYLDEPSLCSPLNYKKTINLSKSMSPAVIVRLTRYKAPNPLFHRCHLEFEAPTGFGVIAVIEEAKLRLTPIGSCHDHVTFGRDDDGKISKEICGTWNFQAPTALATVSAGQKDLVENATDAQVYLQENGRNTTIFFDPGGELQLWFHRGLASTGPDSTAIKIVISVYKKACRTLDQNFFKCPGNYNPSICIPREFQCDGHVNCGNWTQHDELNCMVEAHKLPGPHLSISQIIIGMGIVFVLLLITGLCFWCCCCRRPRRRRSTRQSPRPDGSSQTASHATAPLNPVQEPIGLELCNMSVAVSGAKDTPSVNTRNLDLPPSYDELFPEGTNEAASAPSK